LPGLPVADDELALAATDRNHRVDRLDAGLHRLLHGLARDHSGGDPFERVPLGRVHRALAVEGTAEGVDNTADHAGAHRDVEDSLGALDLVTLTDVMDLAHEHATHIVVL